MRTLLACTSLLSCPMAECSLSCIGGSSSFSLSAAAGSGRGADSLEEVCEDMGGRCIPLELDGR